MRSLVLIRDSDIVLATGLSAQAEGLGNEDVGRFAADARLRAGTRTRCGRLRLEASPDPELPAPQLCRAAATAPGMMLPRSLSADTNCLYTPRGPAAGAAEEHQQRPYA
jgi:hypothetical protein